MVADSSRPWLELCRIFLAPTALADSLAGFGLASALLESDAPPRVLLLFPLVSVLLYSAGMVQNDLFDLPRDRVDAPGKPLPSGRVGLGAAARLATLLTGAGLALAVLADAWLPALAVAAASLAYNAGGKRVPVLGNLLMGACRGANFLVGAAAAGSTDALRTWQVLTGAGCVTLFIAGVTAVSLLEDGPARPRALRTLTLAFPVLASGLLLFRPGSLLCWIAWLALEASLISTILRMRQPPPGTPPAAVFVRGALGALFLFDALVLLCLAPSTREVLIPGLGLWLLALFAWWWKRRWLQSGRPDT